MTERSNPNVAIVTERQAAERWAPDTTYVRQLAELGYAVVPFDEHETRSTCRVLWHYPVGRVAGCTCGAVHRCEE